MFSLFFFSMRDELWIISVYSVKWKIYYSIVGPIRSWSDLFPSLLLVFYKKRTFKNFLFVTIDNKKKKRETMKIYVFYSSGKFFIFQWTERRKGRHCRHTKVRHRTWCIKLEYLLCLVDESEHVSNWIGNRFENHRCTLNGHCNSDKNSFSMPHAQF